LYSQDLGIKTLLGLGDCVLLKDLVEGERSKIKGSVHAWGIMKRKKGVLPRRVVCSRKVEKNKK
jgi:hypothetical protein